MFTGIITHIGQVRSIIEDGEGACVSIQSDLDLASVDIGASIAHSGVCLTVTQKNHDLHKVYISKETLARTTIGNWQTGTSVNLERSLKLGDELGGHLVFGHVDAVAEVLKLETQSGGTLLSVKVPDQMHELVVEKGSVSIDGISLTIAGLNDQAMEFSVIPHTLAVTTLRDLRPGMLVNVEADMLARYVQRSLAGHKKQD